MTISSFFQKRRLNQNTRKQNRKKVHNCSAQNKEMPDGMCVFSAFPDIKENACRIEYAAQNKKNETGFWQLGKQYL